MATVGSQILATDYNSIQDSTSLIFEKGTGTRGYGQGTISATVVQQSNDISANDFIKLKYDLTKIALHAGLQNSTAMSNLPTINSNDDILADHTTAFQNAIAYLDTNRFALAQFTDEEFSPSISQARTTQWAGTIKHEFTVSFTDADQARYFFNSGGSIRMAPRRSGPGTVTTTLWDTRSKLSAESIPTTTTFYSPQIYPVTSNAGDWNSFMNTYAVWTNPVAESNVGVVQRISRKITIPNTANYNFTYAIDDTMNVYIDDVLQIEAPVATSRNGKPPGTKTINLTAGVHVIRVEALNNPVRGGWAIQIKTVGGTEVWHTRQSLAGETISVGSSFISPSVSAASNGAWSTFMNNYAVWPTNPVNDGICIAVINESSVSSTTLKTSYDTLRALYPNYVIYILQPAGYNPSSLRLPAGWGTTGKDIGPISVKRDNGSTNPIDRSDWFEICDLARLPAGAKVGLFLDTSGSMGGGNAVSASYNYFKTRLTSANLTLIETKNSAENYFEPFKSMVLNSNQPQTIYRNFKALQTGTHTFEMQADTDLSVYLDDVLVGSVNSYTTSAIVTQTVTIGDHILKFVAKKSDNLRAPGYSLKITGTKPSDTIVLDTTWSNLLESIGTIVFNYNSTTAAAGTTSTIGFYNLTSVSQQVYKQVSSLSDYTLTARCDVPSNANGGAQKIYFSASFNDKNVAPNNVISGLLTHPVSLRRASGVNVNVVAPTAVTTVNLADVIYIPPVVPEGFYTKPAYFIYGNTTTVGTYNATFTPQAGIINKDDTMLLVYLSDQNHNEPTFTVAGNPANKLTFGRAGAPSTPSEGTTFGVARIKSPSSNPSIAMTYTGANKTKGLLYVNTIPSRFATATYQVIQTRVVTSSDLAGKSPNFPDPNKHKITFTTPWTGYFFVLQGYDVASYSGNGIPGNTIPQTDLTYGIGLTTSAGSWTNSGTYIVPDALSTSGGYLQRADWAYLNSGQTVTVSFAKNSNTKRISPTGATTIMTVIGFQTVQ